MNFKAIFFITTLAVISVASTEIKKKRQSTDQSLGSLAFDTILAVIAPLAVGSIQSLWSSVLKPNKEQKVEFSVKLHQKKKLTDFITF